MNQNDQASLIGIYALAKQLNLPTKTLVDVAHAIGLKLEGGALSRLNKAEREAIEKAVQDRLRDDR
jgi:hypothetical protein